jgi:hypothetical protein
VIGVPNQNTKEVIISLTSLGELGRDATRNSHKRS